MNPFVAFLLCFFVSCTAQTSSSESKEKDTNLLKNSLSDTIPAQRVSSALSEQQNEKPKRRFVDAPSSSMHILVALCDNENQGIVPVPAKIGNGQDPKNNLYWGALYGIKTYFSRSASWELVQKEQKDAIVLERLVFRHRATGRYLVADAYDGEYIQQTTVDFLEANAGIQKDTLTIGKESIGLYGNASLLAYIGHDGLMDFSLEKEILNKDGKERKCMILACYSKEFFTAPLQKANSKALLWTTGLMAPEAYTIHDAIEAFLGSKKESPRVAAAKAYAKYQKCSYKAAYRLLTDELD